MKVTTPAQLDFSALVKPGDRVSWGQCAAEPLELTRELMAQRHRIGGRFSVLLGSTWGDAVLPEHADVVDFRSWTGTGTNRKLADAGALDMICCPYSDFAMAFGPGGANQVDVLLIQLAPKDSNGCYSLSAAHEYLGPLVDSARVVIAEVNAAAPWTHGERGIRDEDLDFVVHTDRPLPESPRAAPSETDLAIASRIAEFIDDGATLQLGVGAVADSVLSKLQDRRHLGIHSAAISDAVASLIEEGVITNSRKTRDVGTTVAGILMGGARLNAHVHRNPHVQMRAISYTHSVHTLAALDGLIAINGAIEVDLTGQVNSEVARGRYVGGVGGAADFIRGARLAKGGLSIIGLPSRAGGHSRIVSQLQGPVSTARCDVGLVVTEFGTADLRGASLSQRVQRMLAIAHPDDRAKLESLAPQAGSSTR